MSETTTILEAFIEDLESGEIAVVKQLDEVRCSPLIKAIKELMSKVAALESDKQDNGMQNIRLKNTVRAIIDMAEKDPSSLTAFNSPLLQLAAMDLYEYDNPHAPSDPNTRAIFEERYEQQKNRLFLQENPAFVVKTGVPNCTEADLRKMMRDPRYWRDKDPEFIEKVTGGFKELYGDG